MHIWCQLFRVTDQGLSLDCTGLNTNYRFLVAVVATFTLKIDDYCENALVSQLLYLVENTVSRPAFAVKQRRALSVPGWVTAWEYRVLLITSFLKKYCVIHFGVVGGKMSLRIWSNYASRTGPLSGVDNAPECVIVRKSRSSYRIHEHLWVCMLVNRVTVTSRVYIQIL